MISTYCTVRLRTYTAKSQKALYRVGFSQNPNVSSLNFQTARSDTLVKLIFFPSEKKIEEKKPQQQQQNNQEVIKEI